MKKVLVYGTAACPYCQTAKQLLQSQGIAFEEIRVDIDLEKRSVMEQKSGRRTVPQIFIGERHVGGFSDLKVLADANELHDWLKD